MGGPGSGRRKGGGSSKIKTVKVGPPKFSKPRQAKRFKTSYGYAGGRKYGGK